MCVATPFFLPRSDEEAFKQSVESITGPITRIISRDGMLGVYNQFSDAGEQILAVIAGVEGWVPACGTTCTRLSTPHACTFAQHVLPHDPSLLPRRQEDLRAGVQRCLWPRHGHLLRDLRGW